MSYLFAPAVYARFRGRHLTEAYKLAPIPDGFTGELDHLACRYYKLTLPNRTAATNIRIECTEPAVRAQVAEVTHLQQKGKVYTLPATIEEVEPKKTDHLVLIVSNSSLTADKVEFRIVIS